MRYLITGGAGFVGSHLAESLICLGHEVISLDDLSTGQIQNLKDLNKKDGFSFVHGSMLDEQLIETLMGKVDGCFHLGAALGVKRILERPYESLISNTQGTEIAAKAAVKHDVKFFMASTSELYGKNPNQPLSEDSDRVLGSPQLVRWAYSEAKAIDESILQMFHQSHGLRYVTGRLFNTVGPRQTGAYGMVMPRFVSAAIKNEQIEVYGGGLQTRVFCHVFDAVDGILRIFFDDALVGHAFNIGGDEEISINQLAERVLRIVGSNSRIKKVAYEEAYAEGFEETMRRVPDTSKLRRMTGWAPKFSLDDTIRDIEKYLRSLL